MPNTAMHTKYIKIYYDHTGFNLKKIKFIEYWKSKL